MLRRLFAALLIPITAFLLAARADDPAKKAKPPAADDKDAVINQERMLTQFTELKAALLRLAQRLERSSRAEDRDRAVVLKEAIKKAGEVNPELKFDTLITLLKDKKAFDLNELKEAMVQASMVADDIRDIIAILLSGNRDALLKAEIKRLEQLIKALDTAIREEKVVRAQTEAGQMDKKALSKAQDKVAKLTEAIARAMTGKGDGKADSKAKGKGGEGKGDGKGQGQGGEGESKEGKQGNKKNDNNLPSPQETPGRKQVQEASGDMRNAQKKIEEEKREPASQDQSEAVRKLEEVRKRLEDILRQLREEELRRLLAALEGRCRRMLAMQKEVYDGTIRVEAAIVQNPDKKASRAEEQRSLQLSDREMEIVREANKCIELLEIEGSGVAFPEVFHQVRDDMVTVQRRLGKADVGVVTQGIEKDIIATLEDMIEALKKAQQGGGNGKPGGKPGNQRLIDLLAELKMIRAMQVRVYNRTVTYGRQYPGEQANDPDIKKELGDLAQREQKIYEVTNNIAKGKNVRDGQ
jgi:hypothetical protein